MARSGPITVAVDTPDYVGRRTKCLKRSRRSRGWVTSPPAHAMSRSDRIDHGSCVGNINGCAPTPPARRRPSPRRHQDSRHSTKVDRVHRHEFQAFSLGLSSATWGFVGRRIGLTSRRFVGPLAQHDKASFLDRIPSPGRVRTALPPAGRLGRNREPPKNQGQFITNTAPA